METIYRTFCPNQNSIFSIVFQIRTTYFFPNSESELYIVRIRTTYLAVWECRFPNQNYILESDFRMKTIYLSEWELHIELFTGVFCEKPLWKKRELFTVSDWKLDIFPQLPNQNSIFIHRFRIRTIYFSTMSESKLYVATKSCIWF